MNTMKRFAMLGALAAAMLLTAGCGATPAANGGSGTTDTGSGADGVAADKDAADSGGSTDQDAAGVDATGGGKDTADKDTADKDTADKDAAPPADAVAPDAADNGPSDTGAADGGAKDTGAPDSGLSGGCTNPADENINKTKDIAKIVGACAQGALGDKAKSKTCILKDTGFSDACSECFAVEVNCTATKCMFECMNGDSPACAACRAKNCDAAFTKCSGWVP